MYYLASSLINEFSNIWTIIMYLNEIIFKNHLEKYTFYTINVIL